MEKRVRAEEEDCGNEKRDPAEQAGRRYEQCEKRIHGVLKE
jgi:hypothetical protein